MSAPFDLSVALLHDEMYDKTERVVTTSITLIDVHDIARSSKTYGTQALYVTHSSPIMRRLARSITSHWESDFGAAYNPNRKEALALIDVVVNLDEAIQKIDLRTKKLPKLIATDARPGMGRITFSEMRAAILQNTEPYLLMVGTGWGMSQPLLDRAEYYLEPIWGPTEYNHLSVRAATAILLDRLLAPR